jgi:hypothetical protein
MPDALTLLLILTIAVALFFDFTNGFHDTANAIGTAIGTRALPPASPSAYRPSSTSSARSSRRSCSMRR